MQLRDYQVELSNKAYEVLKELMIVYLAIEMRVGKSLIALETADHYGAKNVLFTTKLKAIRDIQDDYEKRGYNFDLDVINYEQLHNYETNKYDLIVVDEAHSFGAFPKPSLRTKRLKNIVGNKSLILCSGTPTPESYSQIYHQLWLSEHSPFNSYKNFYNWAGDYVFIKEKFVNRGMKVKDYSNANEAKIREVIDKYFITYTQEEAGFQQHEIDEKIIEVPIKPTTERLVQQLLKDQLFTFPDGAQVVCDSAVKLQSKIHQLYSGTVKTEDKKHKILDISKARYISENFKGSKIAIFYKFIAEGEVLRKVFPNYTEDPFEFNSSSDKIFLSQLKSGSMGVNLETADYLIFYNIDFSSTVYWQSRARIQNFNRTERAKVVYLFAQNGIEGKVMEAVQKKKSYTTSYFRRDYGVSRKKASEENNRLLKSQGSIRSENNSFQPFGST